MKAVLLFWAAIVIIVVVIIRSWQKFNSRQASLEPRKSSDTVEQKLRRMKKLGVINRVPDDPEAFMKQVETAIRLGNEWAENMRSRQGMMGNDGFPLYETVYPHAIEHYVKANGFGFTESDKHNVTTAALHFGTYWRREGRFPKNESGEPDWRQIYGQIQDHFRQRTKGMIQ